MKRNEESDTRVRRSGPGLRAGVAALAATACLALAAPVVAPAPAGASVAPAPASVASAPASIAPAAASADKASTGAEHTGSGPLIAVDDLKVWQGEEQDWNQNGDEPVVVNLMIRTSLGQKGTTRTAWVSEKPRELGSGVDNGDWVHVPDDQGDAHFSASKSAIGGGNMAVRYLSEADVMDAFEAGKPLPADMVMVVSFAFDGDFSGQKTLMDFMNVLRTTVMRKITPVFESAAIPVDITAMPDALRKVQKTMDKVSFDVWDVLLNIDSIWNYVWESAGDYDDLVGLSVIGYMPVEHDLVEWLPVQPSEVGFDSNWTKDMTSRVALGDGWIDVPARVGLLDRSSGKQQFTKVVQSDLPIEDHLGYDLAYYVNPNEA